MPPEVRKEDSRKERNNNTGLVVLITVLVMLVLGMGAFIIYDKVINKTNEPNSEENNKVDNNETITYTNYDLEEAKKLVDKYYVLYDDGTSFDNMSNEDKNAIAFTQIGASSLKEVSCKSLYGKDSYELENSVLGCQSNTEVIDYNILNNEYHKMFGNNNDAAKVGFEKQYHFDYVSTTNQFAKLECFGTCGSPFGIMAIYDVLTAKIDSDDNLIINVGYDLFSFNPDSEKYISKYDSSTVIDSSSDLNDNYIKQNPDKVYEITFTFEKENGDFVLKSFTRK